MTQNSQRPRGDTNFRARRSGRGLVILFATAGLAWAAGANAVANITADWNPALSLRLAPNHPVALAARADDLVRQARYEEAERAALAAVNNSSVAASALSALARLRATSDPESARRLFSYVVQLNRREVSAHLWLVQDLAARRDTERMLTHMDAAMRVSKQTRDFLYPVLAALIADERALAPAIVTFSQSPSWLEGFFGYVIYNNGPLTHLARIITAMPDEAIPRATNIQASLLRRLTQTENYSEARALYREVAPERADSILRDPTFSNASLYPPFDWAYTDGPELRALPIGTRSGGLQLYARTGRGGRVARQMVFLSPGTYGLASEVESLPPSEAGRAVWIIRCVGNSEELAQLPIGEGGTTKYAVAFAIPNADCPAQWLELHIRGGLEPEGFTGVVGSVSIAPTVAAAQS